MEVTTILMGVVALLLVYVVWQYLTDSYTQIANMQKASVKTTLPASTLPPNNNPANFSMSMWFYITSWTCTATPSSSSSVDTSKRLFSIMGTSAEDMFSVKLGACQNDLMVRISCINTETTSQMSTCKVSNVPLQRWVCLIVSVYGKTLDIYLDGKLVRTCVLPNTSNALTSQSSLTNIVIGGGFDGFITSVKYKAAPVNPQEAWNIYSDGYGGSMLQDILNKYKLKLSFLVDNVEKQSVSI
jgi:hypothetical protein